MSYIRNWLPSYQIEVNEIISQINTNKSYTRHKHWKYLIGEHNSAKLCLVAIYNNWAKQMLNDFDSNFIWTLFNTNLSPNPKPNKCDFTNLKAWRPTPLALQKIGF